jgi:uncharacterized membrane protein YeaQ/YmgE (transglycosylase-associated protein family)
MEWSFSGFDWSIVVTIFFGALSGYVASRLLGGEGFGFFGNIVVGVIGGFIGNWIVKLTKVPIVDGFFGNLIASVGGAIVLIFFIELIKYLQRSNRTVKKTVRRRKK